MKVNPKTDDEQIVVRWNRGQTARMIAEAIGWSRNGVVTRVRQLRTLGIPLRPTKRRYDLEQLERELDLVRLCDLAIAAKVEG